MLFVFFKLRPNGSPKLKIMTTQQDKGQKCPFKLMHKDYLQETLTILKI